MPGITLVGSADVTISTNTLREFLQIQHELKVKNDGLLVALQQHDSQIEERDATISTLRKSISYLEVDHCQMANDLRNVKDQLVSATLEIAIQKDQLDMQEIEFKEIKRQLVEADLEIDRQRDQLGKIYPNTADAVREVAGLSELIDTQVERILDLETRKDNQKDTILKLLREQEALEAHRIAQAVEITKVIREKVVLEQKYNNLVSEWDNYKQKQVPVIYAVLEQKYNDLVAESLILKSNLENAKAELFTCENTCKHNFEHIIRYQKKFTDVKNALYE